MEPLRFPRLLLMVVLRVSIVLVSSTSVLLWVRMMRGLLPLRVRLRWLLVVRRLWVGSRLGLRVR